MSGSAPTEASLGAACACGAREVRVVFKCPVHVVVTEGRVVRVLASRDCAEGPIVAECAGCGRATSTAMTSPMAAAALAEASPWPDVSPWVETW